MVGVITVFSASRSISCFGALFGATIVAAWMTDLWTASHYARLTWVSPALVGLAAIVAMMLAITVIRRMGRRGRWRTGLVCATIVAIAVLVFAARRDSLVVASVALAAIVAIVLIILVVTVWPQSLIERRVTAGTVQGLRAEDRLKAESDVRASLLQAITGLVLILSAGFTLIQLVETQKATQAQLRITERGQVSDRFTKAIGQLGDRGVDIRLGGIYGLGKIAEDAPDYAVPSLRVLMSFVRQRLPRAEPAPTKGPVRLSPDVHAAIGVAGTIAGVHYVDQGLRVNLGDTYLSGANLSGATLLGANLSGANLSGANLTGANLLDANLTRGNLTGANLLDANLTRANLSGADMTDVKLRRGQLTSLQLHNVQKEDRIAWIP